MIKAQGTSRTVFLVGKYALKFAAIKYGWQLFLYGCYGNASERKYYKLHSKSDYEGNLSKHVAPSLFCSWFGLIQVQLRCEPMIGIMTVMDYSFFEPICSDNKTENFGILNGKIVCLDYV